MSLRALSLTLMFCAMVSTVASASPQTDPESGYEEARNLFREGRIAQAAEQAYALLDAASENKDLELEFKLLGLINAAQFSLNQYSPDVLQNEYRQEVIARELKDDKRLAGVHNNLGYDLLVTGQAPLSEIIPRLKSANDYYARDENNDGRWYTLMNLTWANRLAEKYDDSIQFGELAVQTARKLKDRHAIIETCINLAETYLEQGRFEQADELFRAAGVEADQKNDRDKYVFDVYFARYLLLTGKGDKAIALAEPAVKELQSIEVFYAELGRAVLADAYFAGGNADGAEALANQIIAKKDDYIPREALISAAIVKAKVLEAKKLNDEADGVLESIAENVANLDSPLLQKRLRRES